MSQARIEKIKHRYFRKVMAHPEGTICHDGDCHFWGSWICTCGLLHALMRIEDAPAIYPDYIDEAVKQDYRMDQIRELPEPIIKEVTPEEMAERTKLLEEVFGPLNREE